jgi:hypothetical protein
LALARAKGRELAQAVTEFENLQRAAIELHRNGQLEAVQHLAVELADRQTAVEINTLEFRALAELEGAGSAQKAAVRQALQGMETRQMLELIQPKATQAAQPGPSVTISAVEQARQALRAHPVRGALPHPAAPPARRSASPAPRPTARASPTRTSRFMAGKRPSRRSPRALRRGSGFRASSMG